MILVGVAALRVVDVPNQKPRTGQRRIETALLPILDQEIFTAGGAVLPKPKNFVRALHVFDALHSVVQDVRHRDPALVGFAPSRGMDRRIPTAAPASGGHEAKTPNPF